MLKTHTPVSVLVFLLVFTLAQHAGQWLCEHFGRNTFSAGTLTALAAIVLAELVEVIYLYWRARRKAAREAAFSFLD